MCVTSLGCESQNGCCASCVTAGVPCTFANPGSLKERPPTQKYLLLIFFRNNVSIIQFLTKLIPRLLFSRDVDHLQARIRSLERLIHAVAPTLDLDNLPVRGLLDTIPQRSLISSTSSKSDDPNSASDHQGGLLSESDSTLDKASSGVTPIWSSVHWTQPDNQESSGRYGGITFESGHYVGTNAVFSLPDSATNKAWGTTLPSASDPSRELSPVEKIIRHQYQQRVLGTQHFYPEPDLELHLLSLYFTHFHPLHPILHPPTFIQMHSSGLAQTDTSFRCLCLYVFALASRFSDDPRVMLDIDGHPHPSPQIAGLRFCFSATSYLHRPIAMPATLYDLQSYVLLCFYSLGAVSLVSSWSVAGIGLQRAQVTNAACIMISSIAVPDGFHFLSSLGSGRSS